MKYKREVSWFLSVGYMKFFHLNKDAEFVSFSALRATRDKNCASMLPRINLLYLLDLLNKSWYNDKENVLAVVGYLMVLSNH